MWAKVGYGPLQVEAELVGQIGSLSVDSDAATPVATSYSVRKFGGAARAGGASRHGPSDRAGSCGTAP